MLRLNSDFRDYYDHHFAPSYQKDGFCFDRLSRTDLDRKAMFARLKQLSLATPEHGIVKHLFEAYQESLNLQGYRDKDLLGMLELMQVVVYTDPFAHAGEGKIRCSYTEAMRDHPDRYASIFIPQNAAGTGTSLRLLRIGRRQFWLRYTSQDDWRSNAGDVSIEVLCEERPMALSLTQKQPEPLLAIDFISGPGNTLLAVDYNTAPMLRGTGIEDRLTAAQVYEEITVWFDEVAKNNTINAHERDEAHS